MILSGKNAEVQTGGVESSSLMTIDVMDQSILMRILSEGLYKDSIGSTIREWASNALDSHREAGIDEPIQVKVAVDRQGIWTLTVKDVGVGMSPDRQEKVLKKYAASTKRNTNDQLGAFGLGLKSGLSYQDSFTFSTYYDGMEYKYVMYKGEDGTKLDLMFSDTTAERNGTEFQIQIKSGDVLEFKTSIKRQLAYFEGVYFDVPDISNDFKILKSENWKFSTLSVDPIMHLCLDNVYYPIDFQRLGIPAIRVPIGLNFSIKDGIEPIPSREDIKYTPSVKALITDKIKAVADYFYDKQAEQCGEQEDYLSFLKAMEAQFIVEDTLKVDLNELKFYTVKKKSTPSLKGVKFLSPEFMYSKKHELLRDYHIRGQFSYGKYYKEVKFDNLISYFIDSSKLIFCEEPPVGVKLAFMKDHYQSAYTVFKQSSTKLLFRNGYYGNSGYYQILKLRDHPRAQWRAIIKEYQEVAKTLINKIQNIDTIIPDEDWLQKRKDSRKKSSAVRATMEEINPKWAIPAQRGNFYNKFEQSAPIAVPELGVKLKSLIVYGSEDQKDRLDRMAKAAIKQKIKFCILGQRDLTKITDVSSFITIDQYMEGNTKQFRRIATAFLLEAFLDSNSKVFQCAEYIRHLNTETYTSIIDVKNYVKRGIDRYCSTAIKNTMLDIAKANNAWDEDIIENFVYLQKEIKNYSFVTLLNFATNGAEDFNEEQIKVGVDLLKYRKVKLNLEHYPKAQKVEVVQEEELIENI